MGHCLSIVRTLLAWSGLDGWWGEAILAANELRTCSAFKCVQEHLPQEAWMRKKLECMGLQVSKRC